MTPGIRFGFKLTTAAVEMMRELRAEGVTDDQDVVASVTREVFYTGAHFIRAVGMNRATLDFILRRVFDEVYAAPIDENELLRRALWGDAIDFDVQAMLRDVARVAHE